VRYFQRVAFQAPTPVQSAAGDMSYTYETVDALAAVPARITARRDETRGDRMTVLEDRYDILIAGKHDDIVEDMAVLDGESVYDIIEIQPPAIGRRGRTSTRLIAQRVAM
jgi:hypothetical protein